MQFCSRAAAAVLLAYRLTLFLWKYVCMFVQLHVICIGTKYVVVVVVTAGGGSGFISLIY